MTHDVRSHYVRDFILLNVPQLRPAWPYPSFCRVLPLLRQRGFKGNWWDENVRFYRHYFSPAGLNRARVLVQTRLHSMTPNTFDATKARAFREVLQVPLETILGSLEFLSRVEAVDDLEAYRGAFERDRDCPVLSRRKRPRFPGVVPELIGSPVRKPIGDPIWTAVGHYS